MDTFNSLLEGVIPDTVLKKIIDAGFIENGQMKQVQPASLDVLPDLNHMYEVDYFYTPRQNEKVEKIITDMVITGKARKIKYPILMKGKRYLVRLREKITGLPFYARMNPKSSPGRIFLHSRLVSDGHSAYDEIPAGYSGAHWLMIMPKCFSVELCETEPISQIRFFKGNARLNRKELDRELGTSEFISFPGQAPLFDSDRIEVFGQNIASMPLTVDFDTDVIAYVTKQLDTPIKICNRDSIVSDYFDCIYKDQIGSNGLIMHEKLGYLLGSFETIKLPVHLSSEVIAISEKYGDLRSHYAGYIDPGFGLGTKGNSITLEVIAFEPGVCIRHRQRIAEIQYEYMSTPPDVSYIGNYVSQPKGPQVPKYFKK